MILYGTLKASQSLADNPRIDYIEMIADKPLPTKFTSGFYTDTMDIFWDESDWGITGDEMNYVIFRCKGVYINDEYANGELSLFKDAVIKRVTVAVPDSIPEDVGFELVELYLYDEEEEYHFDESVLKEAEIAFTAM